MQKDLMLQARFRQLAATQTQDTLLIEKLWQEIADAYSVPARHYHNLSHLENLIAELEPCRHLLQDELTLLYAVFYHDIVYDVLRNDNEERSAILAVTRLSALNLSDDRIEKCRQQILATKSHAYLDDDDANLFTDADLSILGKDNERYITYSQQIRAEYAVYPDELYLPGRAKVLRHFLDMPRIYKTACFFDLYEKQARYNLEKELETLS